MAEHIYYSNSEATNCSLTIPSANIGIMIIFCKNRLKKHYNSKDISYTIIIIMVTHSRLSMRCLSSSFSDFNLIISPTSSSFTL